MSTVVRQKLKRLGRRRAAHEQRGDALMREIRAALVEAEGVVPRTEAAALLGVHRTTLYRVYR